MWAEAQLLTAGLSNAAFLEKYKKRFSSVSCILPAVLPWLPFGAFVLMFFCFLTLLNLFFLSLLKCLITLSGFSFLNQRIFLPRKVLEKWFCLAYFFFFPCTCFSSPSFPSQQLNNKIVAQNKWGEEQRGKSFSKPCSSGSRSWAMQQAAISQHLFHMLDNSNNS